MKLTMEEKLIMCKEHVIESKSLSHISEEHENYNKIVFENARSVFNDKYIQKHPNIYK